MILRVDLKFRQNPVDGFKIRVYSNAARDAISGYIQEKAQQMETYAKSNHPWTNRTGNAEAGLHATIEGSAAGWRKDIVLSHSVYYGVYLEFSMGRRFAIIEPTVNRFAPIIQSELSSIF